MGYYYENGIRTSVNLTEAAVWYEKAAQKGHAEAAMRLALLYAQGKGVEKMRKKLSLIWNRLQKPEIPMLSIM